VPETKMYNNLFLFSGKLVKGMGGAMDLVAAPGTKTIITMVRRCSLLRSYMIIMV